MSTEDARDVRGEALDDFLDEYEREFGAFDDAELAAIERRSRSSAIVVRGPGTSCGDDAHRLTYPRLPVPGGRDGRGAFPAPPPG